MTWRPEGTTMMERLSTAVLGSYPQLLDPEAVWSGKDRFDVRADTSGTVHIEFEILMKGFSGKGVEFGS